MWQGSCPCKESLRGHSGSSDKMKPDLQRRVHVGDDKTGRSRRERCRYYVKLAPSRGDACRNLAEQAEQSHPSPLEPREFLRSPRASCRTWSALWHFASVLVRFLPPLCFSSLWNGSLCHCYRKWATCLLTLWWSSIK